MIRIGWKKGVVRKDGGGDSQRDLCILEASKNTSCEVWDQGMVIVVCV